MTNLAQGEAVRAIKAVDGAAQVGSAFDVAPMYPATPSPEDAAAAERWHRFQNLWFLYPALHGRYPDGVLQADRQAELLGFRDGDEKIVRAAFDFVGFNYYTPILVKAAPEGNGIPGLDTQSFWATMHGEHPKTDIGWTVYPQGFYDILTRMAKETGSLPIEITENGASYNTAPDGEGRIRDAERIDYLRGHLEAVARAIGDGVPIRAYHCWSLLDNFEWAYGYSQRFGIVHVDFANGQRRTVKDSGRWYAGVPRPIASVDDRTRSASRSRGSSRGSSVQRPPSVGIRQVHRVHRVGDRLDAEIVGACRDVDDDEARPGSRRADTTRAARRSSRRRPCQSSKQWSMPARSATRGPSRKSRRGADGDGWSWKRAAAPSQTLRGLEAAAACAAPRGKNG